MSEAFSNALNNVLQTIDPGKRPSAEDCFPPQCRNVDLRVNAGESPEQWFRRLVDGPLEGDLQSCRVEDNLAIFLQFGSEAERRFRYLRCQALLRRERSCRARTTSASAPLGGYSPSLALDDPGTNPRTPTTFRSLLDLHGLLPGAVFC